MNEFELTIDYSQSLEQMITAGKYDWVKDKITEKNFPLPSKLFGQKITVSGKLFYFNRLISVDDIISEMDRDGYRPAILPEFLALGETQPASHYQFPITIFGSTCVDAFGRYLVPCFHFDGGKKRLGLILFANQWIPPFQFFGVRK